MGDIFAQRRKDKDIPHLYRHDDKSKEHGDKHYKLKDTDTTNDPDIKGDPDLKKGGLGFDRILVARKLVRMAKFLVAWDMSGLFDKTYEVHGNELIVSVDWSNAQEKLFGGKSHDGMNGIHNTEMSELKSLSNEDFENELLIESADKMSRIQDELIAKGGVKFKPDNNTMKSYSPNETDLTIEYEIVDADEKEYERILRKEGFKRKG